MVGPSAYGLVYSTLSYMFYKSVHRVGTVLHWKGLKCLVQWQTYLAFPSLVSSFFYCRVLGFCSCLIPIILGQILSRQECYIVFINITFFYVPQATIQLVSDPIINVSFCHGLSFCHGYFLYWLIKWGIRNSLNLCVMDTSFGIMVSCFF